MALRKCVALANLVAVLSGCAAMLNPYQPGSRLSPELAERYGCDWAQVVARAETLKEGLELGQNWIPRVGWDACEVMAHVGGPTDIDYQQTTRGQSVTWWYHMENTDAHMVSLSQEGRGWIVTYVGW